MSADLVPPSGETRASTWPVAGLVTGLMGLCFEFIEARLA